MAETFPFGERLFFKKYEPSALKHCNLCARLPSCLNQYAASPVRGENIAPILLKMKTNRQVRRILLYQNLGFLSLILLFVLDELVRLSTSFDPHHPLAFLLQRSTLEIFITIAVWYLVSMSTRRILQRLHYLEKFLRVCAWCRRINYKGDWMRLEEFMQQGFDTPTTHGICKDCFQKQQDAAEHARAARREPQTKK